MLTILLLISGILFQVSGREETYMFVCFFGAASLFHGEIICSSPKLFISQIISGSFSSVVFTFYEVV